MNTDKERGDNKSDQQLQEEDMLLAQRGVQLGDSSTQELDEEELKQKAEEEVAKLSPNQIFENWIKEPKNMEMLSEQADLLRKKFNSSNGGWFDLIKVTKFTKLKKIKDALDVLNLLKLAGLLVAEMRGGKEMYKITINVQARLSVLKNLLLEVELKKKELEVEISQLEAINTNKSEEDFKESL